MNDNHEYYRENYSDMVRSWKSLADTGDVSAAKMLGDLLYRGPSGNEKNIETAFPYTKMAADGGDTIAQRIVGAVYEEGTASIAENPDLAMSYYLKAAYGGDSMAQCRLGCMYIYHKEEYTLGLHWLCCAYLNGLQDATGYLNKWIENMANANGNDGTPYYDIVQYIMAEIKEKGINPSRCDYSCINFDAAPKKEGCYIATAVYGSYDCPQVWVLRRFRDNILKTKWYGRMFIRVYYTISPVLVKWFAQAEWFQVFWRRKLDSLVLSFQRKGVEATPYKDEPA